MEEINVNQEAVNEVAETIADSGFDANAAMGLGLIVLSCVGAYHISKFVINKGIKPMISKCKALKKPIDAVAEETEITESED